MDGWLIAAASVFSCWKLETQATDKRRIQCSVNRKKRKAPTTTTKEKQETTVNWWKENLMPENSLMNTGGEC